MKLWFTTMCGPGSLESIQELWEPIKDHFAGISAVYFGDRDDLEARYLEIVKGEGRIVYLPYVGRHDTARTIALHSGVIQNGDWVIMSDSLEYPSESFIREIVPELVKSTQGINAYYYYGKIFLFQYHESLVFNGTPHEGCQRRDGQMRAVELSYTWPDESKVRMNMRPQKRDKFHWVDHYARYYISMPWGSNHCLLGNEKRGDPMKIYQEREALRIEFREYLRGLGVPLTVEGLKKHLTKIVIDEMIGNKPRNKIYDYINKECILSDFYRYHFIGDKSVVDDHSWSNMVKL